MKLKYKKMIIMISMCTMGIGMVTFSINKVSKDNTTIVEKDIEDMVAFNDEEISSPTDNRNLLAADIPSITPIPTIAPEEELSITNVLETNVLEKDAHKEINKLIKKYLQAKLTHNIEDFKELVNDTSLLNIEDIERKTKYIENYENLACYTIKGLEDNSYIVYAYHEVKFSSIDTLAPAMNEFYVKTDENNKPYIYLGGIDSETEEYLSSARNTDDVMDLIYNVNEKLQKAVENDTALSQFYYKLEETAQDVTKNEQ